MRTPLVEYPSSDEEDTTNEPQPPLKKRKLPSLPADLLPQVPVDNPALHQGRRRTTPHVDGQFAAYVYVPVLVPKRSRLFKLLRRIFSSAKRDVPTLHAISFAEDDVTDAERAYVELHVSLTRPAYLHAHQRENFKRAVQAAARSKRKFSASFATLSELTNDERTRTFLTLEVGAGHDDFKVLSNALGPALRSIRQKEFYEDPRFHVSIAWALLDASQSSISPTSQSANSLHRQFPHSDAKLYEESSSKSSSAPSEAAFPTIPCFPLSLISRLQEEFSRELVLSGVASFEVEEVHVRIGKEVRRWKLSI